MTGKPRHTPNGPHRPRRPSPNPVALLWIGAWCAFVAVWIAQQSCAGGMQ